VHNVAFVVDEREVVSADFISGEDVAARFGGAEQSQAQGGAERRDENPFLTFYTAEVDFESGGGWLRS